MRAQLIGFNTYKRKTDNSDWAEVHLATDLPMKNGCQVLIARIPYDPYSSLIVGQEYDIISEPYTYNGELKTRITGLK